MNKCKNDMHKVYANTSRTTKPHKLTKHILALATSLNLTLTSLSLNALALDNHTGNAGDLAGGTHQNNAYSSYLRDNLGWLVEAYVSTTDDGKIDTSVQSLGGSGSASAKAKLKRIGGILYSSNSLAGFLVPAGTNTDERNLPRKLTSTVKPGGSTSLGSVTQYNFPATYTADSDNTKVNIAKSNGYYIQMGTTTSGAGDSSRTLGLPTNFLDSYDYDTQIKQYIEGSKTVPGSTLTFVQQVVEDLKKKMGDNILDKLLGKSGVSDSVYNQYKSVRDSQGVKAAAARLFPDSDDPLVQWAVVVTPIAKNTARGSLGGFWVTGEGTDSSLPYVKADDAVYCMDAYTLAYYNRITIAAGWNSTGFPAVDLGVGSSPTFYNLFNLAFTDKNNANGNSYYLGIKTTTASQLAGYKNNAGYLNHYADLASRGGITIALSDAPEEQPEIPVYYSIYQPYQFSRDGVTAKQYNATVNSPSNILTYQD